MNPSAEELAALPIFAAADPEELEHLASWFEVEERDAGAVLAHEGDFGYAFYILADGTATVLQGDQEIRQLGPGSFFGELSIVGDGHRTATVRATSPVTLWSMFGTEFRSLEAEFPGLAERIRSAYA